jgi:AcrR family transcriptional regulator
MALPAALSSEPVGRKDITPEALATERRTQVLLAGVDVFAERGYGASTVEQIVTAAKISLGTYYSLFANKEECFLAACEYTIARVRGQIEAAFPAGGPASRQVLVVLETLLGLIAADPLAARVVLVEAQTAGPRALALYQAELDALVPGLRRCRRQSPFAADLPETLEVATIGGLAWYLQQRLLAGEGEELRAFLPEVAEIVLEPYLGRGGAAALLAEHSAA